MPAFHSIRQILNTRHMKFKIDQLSNIVFQDRHTADNYRCCKDKIIPQTVFGQSSFLMKNNQRKRRHKDKRQRKYMIEVKRRIQANILHIHVCPAVETDLYLKVVSRLQNFKFQNRHAVLSGKCKTVRRNIRSV